MYISIFKYYISSGRTSDELQIVINKYYVVLYSIVRLVYCIVLLDLK